jgi:hypothetical protein
MGTVHLMRITTGVSYQQNGGHTVTYFVGAALSKLKLMNAIIFQECFSYRLW